VSGPAGTGGVHAEGTRGLQVGDGNTQVNVFGAMVVGAGTPRPVFAVPPPRAGDVARSGLSGQLLDRLTAAGSGGVGLAGAGGFGKTTLARMLVHDRRARESFGDGMVWVTLGQQVAGAELAELVNNLCESLAGRKPLHTDPLQAGAQLGRALGERRILLVVDDVWSTSQLEPFLVGGPNTVRLVTTRQLRVLPQGVDTIDVNAMTSLEARQLLTAGLGPVPGDLVARLLDATGRWPVLLGLVNGAARTDVTHGARPDQALADIRDQLEADGIAILDVADPDHRDRAVSATLEVSFARLAPAERDRYTELAVFGEDVDIPLTVLARYWRHTGGWTPARTRTLCRNLAEACLLATYRLDEPARIRLHDVIRAYLLRHLVGSQLPALHAALLDAHRDLAPAEATGTAWWRLPDDQTYLWEHAPTHLHAAGLDKELETTLTHPGWLLGKLTGSGPAGLESDLALSSTATGRALAVAVRQNAHLLAPFDPPGSLAATLASRLSDDGPAASVAATLAATIASPHLRPAAPLPDLPNPGLTRVLTGHTDEVLGLVAAADGSWLATGSIDGTVRIWDPATGQVRHTPLGHTSTLVGMAAAADGSWLATGSIEGTVRIWDPATGQVRHTPIGHTAEEMAMAAAADGSWLATGSIDGTVRIWDPATGQVRHTLIGHTERVFVLAVAPDGSWLASASNDRTVRIWDPATGQVRHTLTDEMGPLAAAVDGSWLATGGVGTVRIWDVATGQVRRTLIGHGEEVAELAAVANGSWLASVTIDGRVQIWDVATGDTRRTFTCHTGRMMHMLAAAADGSWIATVGWDETTVRIWDMATGDTRRTLTDHIDGIDTLAAAADGSWIATDSWDGTVRIWDVATGQVRHTITDQGSALAAAADGSWLATVGWDGTVRIWDVATGQVRHTITDHVYALAAATDGSWLATVGWDGTVRIWDVVTGQARHTLTGLTGHVDALAAATDGSWLATADRDGTVRIWDPATGGAVAGVRVDGPLYKVVWIGPRLIAVGARGCYVWAMIKFA
jgi:WD40 repeat protein